MEVICIDNSKIIGKGLITIGKKYSVTLNNYDYQLTMDNGDIGIFKASRFIQVAKIRKYKLSKIK
jgi:hypothetical protein